MLLPFHPKYSLTFVTFIIIFEVDVNFLSSYEKKKEPEIVKPFNALL